MTKFVNLAMTLHLSRQMFKVATITGHAEPAAKRPANTARGVSGRFV